MGRFYKTSKANHIDYAFRLPAEYIANAVSNKDKQIDDTIKSAAIVKQGIEDEKKGALSLNYSPQDAELFNQRIAEHEAAIDDVTRAIMENPLDSYKQRAKIMEVQSKLRSDIIGGTLGKINQNASVLAQFQSNNKSANPTVYNKILNYGLSKWGHSFDEKGNFRNLNDYLPQKISSTNVTEEATKLAGKFKENGKYGGEFGNESMVKQNMSAQIYNALATNEDVIQSELQKVKYGYYGDDKTNFTPEQQKQFVLNKIKNEADNVATLALHKSKSTKTPEEKLRNQPAIPEANYDTVPIESDVTNDIIGLKANTNINPDNVSIDDLEQLKGQYANKIAYSKKLLADETLNEDSRAQVYDNFLLNQAKQLQAESLVNKMSTNSEQQIPLSALPTSKTSKLEGLEGWPSKIGKDGVPLTNGLKSTFKKQIKTGLSTNYGTRVLVSNIPELNGKSINQLVHEGVIQRKILNYDNVETQINQIKSIASDEGFDLTKDVSVTTTDTGKTITYKHTLDNNKVVTLTKTFDYKISNDKYQNFSINYKVFDSPTKTLYQGSPLIGVTAKFNGKPIKVFYKLSDVSATVYANIMGNDDNMRELNSNTIFHQIISSVNEGDEIKITPSGTIKLGKDNDGLYILAKNNKVRNISHIKDMFNMAYTKLTTKNN
jgi:hypothetical protein